MRLILHAGTHKTGTTSIQHFVHRHRERLGERGLYYPPSYTKSELAPDHHRLVRAFVDGPSAGADSLVDSLQAETPPGGAVLLSSESLYRDVHGCHSWTGYSRPDAWQRRERYLRDLASMLGDFDVTFVIFFRRVDEYAESLYKTLIGGGHFTERFDEHLASGALLFDYRRQIDAIGRHFTDVRVLPYSAQDVITPFFAAIGYPKPAGAVARQNTATDARLTFWIAETSRAKQLAKREVKKRREFAWTADARARFSDFGAASFWESVEARIAFCERWPSGLPDGFFPPMRHEATVPARIDAETVGALEDAYARWLARGKR